MIALLLFACMCSSEPAGPPAAGSAPPVAPEAPEAPEAPAAPKAPTRTVQGLALGEADDAAIAAWVAERGLECPEVASPRRTTRQRRCQGTYAPSLLPDRGASGALTEILIARLDDGPAHHLSTIRKYSLPADVAADYHAAVDAITAQLGPPTQTRRVDDLSAFDSPLARFATRWQFSDLRVDVSILKAAGSYISLNEVWVIPGVEEQAQARGGGSLHGDLKPASPANNPHVADDP